MSKKAQDDQRWQISSYCNNGSCVEVARLSDDLIAIRDTKHRMITCTPQEFNAFLEEIKNS